MGIVTALDLVAKQVGDLFLVEFPGEIEVFFRLPSYKQVSQYAFLLNLAATTGTEYLVYEHVFRQCVEDDYLANYNNDLHAGIPETITKNIFYLSGIDDNSFEYTEALLDLYREQAESIPLTIKRTICQVFASYKYEDLDKLNYQNLITLFVEAEKVLIERGIIESEFTFTAKTTKKQTRIEDLIQKDQEEYKNFNRNETGPRIDPRESARLEEEKFRQALQNRKR